MKYYVKFSDMFYSWCIFKDVDDLNSRFVKSGFLTEKSAYDYIKANFHKEVK